jgi:hypothetical protein
VSRRKHISWKTRCASAVLALMNGREPGWYADAKTMTEDQFLSLFHFDHNILHETGHLDADKYWNLMPMLIRAHRKKTKTDAAIIAKGRRLRREGPHTMRISAETRQAVGNDKVLGEVIREAYQKGLFQGRDEANKGWLGEANRPGGAVTWNVGPTIGAYWMDKGGQLYKYEKGKPRRVKKIQSRGFDKTRRRKMDGTVTKRER